jgi:hypothetical protein
MTQRFAYEWEVPADSSAMLMRHEEDKAMLSKILNETLKRPLSSWINPKDREYWVKKAQTLQCRIDSYEQSTK